MQFSQSLNFNCHCLLPVWLHSLQFQQHFKETMCVCTMEKENGLQHQKQQPQFNCTILRRICGKVSRTSFFSNMDNLHVSISIMNITIKE